MIANLVMHDIPVSNSIGKYLSTVLNELSSPSRHSYSLQRHYSWLQINVNISLLTSLSFCRYVILWTSCFYHHIICHTSNLICSNLIYKCFHLLEIFWYSDCRSRGRRRKIKPKCTKHLRDILFRVSGQLLFETGDSSDFLF